MSLTGAYTGCCASLIGEYMPVLEVFTEASRADAYMPAVPDAFEEPSRMDEYILLLEPDTLFKPSLIDVDILLPDPSLREEYRLPPPGVPPPKLLSLP